MTNYTSAGLAHGELYVPVAGQTPQNPWRSWGIKLNGAYPENQKLDMPLNRRMEVFNIGPEPMHVATIPDGEITHTVEPGQTIVLREPTHLSARGFTNVTVREFFNDAEDEQAAA